MVKPSLNIDAALSKVNPVFLKTNKDIRVFRGSKSLNRQSQLLR